MNDPNPYRLRVEFTKAWSVAGFQNLAAAMRWLKSEGILLNHVSQYPAAIEKLKEYASQ